MIASILGLKGERAAEGIESEQGVGTGHQGCRRNSDAGDQIPADDFAKGLIESNAIHVYRDSLGRAQQRRGGVAAIIYVGLKRIALDFVDVHAREPPSEKIGEVERSGFFDIVFVRCLDWCRNFVQRKVDSRKRHRRNDVDFHSGNFGGFLALRLLCERTSNNQQKRPKQVLSRKISFQPGFPAHRIVTQNAFAKNPKTDSIIGSSENSWVAALCLSAAVSSRGKEAASQTGNFSMSSSCCSVV